MCFTMFSKEKHLFRLENEEVQKVQNWNFSKDLVHGFSKKLDIFFIFFRQNRPSLGCYPVVSTVSFPNTYPLGSDLSSG